MNFYDGLDVHRLLVGDEVRTRSFYDSIRASVHEGHVVLDVGAGSGILSLFAARAGARRVYAVERAARAAALARQMVAANHLSEVVVVIEADAGQPYCPSLWMSLSPNGSVFTVSTKTCSPPFWTRATDGSSRRRFDPLRRNRLGLLPFITKPVVRPRFFARIPTVSIFPPYRLPVRIR